MSATIRTFAVEKEMAMTTLLTDKRSWAVKKRAFSIWQQTPHKVAPQSDMTHTCQSCGTEFQGNFCPRCGQSARVGRFSFKTAFLLFLDIWGIGNRGMFRTIRDLLLRPGYMIRDYIGGCQSAYFPPFKMFFILATFSFLLSHGISLDLEEKTETAKEEIADNWKIEGDERDVKTMQFIQKIPKTITALEKKNPSLFSFAILVLISAPLYLFFRRSPAIPDLRYSEHLVALVYTSNTYSIYRILATLMPFGLLSDVFKLLSIIMIFVALKQLTGYSKRRLLWYIVLTNLIFLSLVIVIGALVLAYVHFVKNA